MRRILITLSGARASVLDQCPTERGKFEGIGGAVLTTSTLATISMWFALSSAIGVHPVAAMPLALLWGLAILSLDRWLVATIPSSGGRRWKLALPRVAMAVLLGFVISTPLVLQIFRAEIDAQIVEIKQRRADDFALDQKRGAIGADVARDRQAVAGLQQVIASQGDVPLDPASDVRIRALTQQRDDQRKQMQSQYQQWQCQLYGGPQCPRKGDGPLAAASEAGYRNAKKRVDDLNGQIEDRKRELTATGDAAKRTRLEQAQADLPAARQRLTADERRQADLQRSFDAQNGNTHGLLIRLQALDEVSGKDVVLNGARILLFLLFLLIECLPVAVKLLQKTSNYDQILALEAKKELQQAKKKIVPVPGNLFGGESGGSVHDIWGERQREQEEWRPARPSGPGRETGSSGGEGGIQGAPEWGSGPGGPPAGTRPEASGDGTPPSSEHEAIRNALDTRVTRTVDSSDRSDGQPLYTDDDDF
ncbi:protein of unknown function (DUF4407) [Actinomadura glauciflava]|uniref:DUF4407 domain-containing protein n=1 Tax=Actinomadura luteofluorescens TaxID=46163 RepID=UPI0021646EC5|nr:DUF4407 domain-containing protein [Actinomadura glauciflava]MCR3742425.1 protein of unknown function (DUF4407) [Actinomadura glauciflava]